MCNFKILLVDDEEDILEVIGQRIKSWGYEVITATNACQALELLHSQNPDAIVLDYRMPQEDGIATLKDIRKNNKEIPVIMFTAYPDKKSIKGSENLGVIAFIPKFSVHTDSETALQSALNMAVKKLSNK